MTDDNGGIALDAPDIRTLDIPQLRLSDATLKVRAKSSLIMHKWSEKAMRQLEGDQTGKAKEQKAPKNPDEEWKSAAYVLPGKEDLPDWEPGKYFFPAEAFKHAFLFGVGQLGDVKGMPKTKATAYVFIPEHPVLDFERVDLRTDITRNPTQMVYRPEFFGWSADLNIVYNAQVITIEQIVSLFNLGGLGGVGEWRPSAPKNKSGSHGMFEIESVIG